MSGLRPVRFVVLLAILPSLKYAIAKDPNVVRVVTRDAERGGQPAIATAEVGDRVVVVGSRNEFAVEVTVRRLPPGKQAVIYVDVRPQQDGADVNLPRGLPLGHRFRLVNVNSGHCLAVKDGSHEPRTKLCQLEKAAEDPSQMWRLTPAAHAGWYALQNQSSEQVVALPDDRKNAGANLVQIHFDETNADQQWRPLWVADDRFVIVNRRSGHALAVAYGAAHPGATICQWPLHLDWKQHQWRFEAVDPQ
jgi:hypothetical protein